MNIGLIPEKLALIKTLLSLFVGRELPPQIHYNEQMLSNYKYFGSRKFPEIDKIVINEGSKAAEGWMTLPHKSLFNYWLPCLLRT